MSKGLDLNTIIFAGGAYLLYETGMLDSLLIKVGLPPKGKKSETDVPDKLPGGAMTEDQAALLVASKRPDICTNMASQSGGVWQCRTSAETIATIKHWFAEAAPPETKAYGSLVAFAKARGWA